MVAKVFFIGIIAIVLKALQGKKWCYYLILGCIYFFLILNITLMGRAYGIVHTVDMDIFQKYSHMFTTGWWGDGQYIAKEIIGNIILFVPLGQLIATVIRGKFPLLIAVISLCVSLSIETTQYCYGLGTFELADLIHNTIGAVCGYYIYKTDFYLKGQELWNHIRSRFLRR